MIRGSGFALRAVGVGPLALDTRMLEGAMPIERLVISLASIAAVVGRRALWEVALAGCWSSDGFCVYFPAP